MRNRNIIEKARIFGRREKIWHQIKNM
jgi:hypothetical protein